MQDKTEDEPRFRQACGGAIVDRNGLEVLRVNVGGLSIADSARVMAICSAALNASPMTGSAMIEFKEGQRAEVRGVDLGSATSA